MSRKIAAKALGRPYKPDGSLEGFFRFLDGYGDFIRSQIPGDYTLEYGSRPYMAGIWEHLESVVAELPKGAKILDLGCGRGHFTAYLKARGLNPSGVDVHQIKRGRRGDDLFYDQGIDTPKVYPRLWRAAKRRYGVQIKGYNGRQIPMPAQSFDAVLFYAVYEHIPLDDVDEVTRESFRVLKPGGKAFIFRCPSSWSYTEHLGQWLGLGGHPKLYGKRELRSKLEAAGYEILKFGRTDFFPHYIGLSWVQKLINLAAPHYGAAERLLGYTPLRLLYHHFRVVMRKPKG